MSVPDGSGGTRRDSARARRQPSEEAANGAAADVIQALGDAEMVGEARSRARTEATPSTLTAADRRSGWLVGGSFVLVVALGLILVPPTIGELPVLLACIAIHAIASSVEFEIGPGSALPTTPALFVALFLLQPQLAPVVAAGGLVVAAQVARIGDPSRHERPLVLVGSAWHAVGPALVFAAAGPVAPTLGSLPVVGLALVAQFAFDAAASWVRNCYGLGVPTRALVDALRFTFAADALLASAGLLAAIAAPGSPAALLLLLPLTALLGMLQRDRRAHITNALTLGRAYSESADRARRDALTGLRNRLAWEEALERLAPDERQVGLILADVDGLKQANDSFGHDAGDRLLVTVAEILRRATPDPGGADGLVVARLGGDEFGILLPGASRVTTGLIAGRLRILLGATPRLESGIQVSASVGSAVAGSGAEIPDALLEADRGVYDEKHVRRVARA